MNAVFARAPAWRCIVACVLVLLVAGCGGGGGSQEQAVSLEGTREARSIDARANGTRYPLNIYFPPASAGPRSSLPVVYALDGDTWFEALVAMAETTRARVIIVGIGNSAQRARDFVPPNNCTSGGGGHVAYFDFIRNELVPYVEANIGGDARRRVLLGHSHGGSFVLYALFAQAAGQHSFSAYLASDASVSCMTSTANAWEQSYASANTSLPVRLHISYATQGNHDANVFYAQAIADRRYANLVMRSQVYTGTHTGIIPAAFADAVAFALSP